MASNAMVGRSGASEDQQSPGVEASRQPAQRFSFLLYWTLTTLLVFSIVGLTLAVVGVFYPVVLLLIGVSATVGLGRWGWEPFRRAAGTLIIGGLLPVATAMVIIVVSALSAGLFSAEHVITNRDPGVYLTTGRWLADEGTLLVSGKVGGFADMDGITSDSPGFYEVRDDGTLDPQFLHLLPVWAAVAHWIGGDQALLRVNAAVIALALASVWLFAATVLQPWFAVLATASVAVLLPTVHFARDLYSEPLAVLLIFGGLAFLSLARGVRQPGLSLLAGLMIAAATMTRIDGWVVVIAIVTYLMAVWWTAQENDASTTIAGFVHPVFLGILISGSVGLLDGVVRARPYLAERSSQIVLMFGLLIAVTFVGVLALRWPEPVRRLAAWFDRHRATIAWVIPIMIVAAAAVMFLLRPLVQETHAAGPDPSIELIQELDGLPIDGSRTYNEWSMRWLSWYLGVFGLSLAVFGLAWAWRRSILGLARFWPFLLTVSLTTALYVVRPSITPDQLWAMRRFLPVVLPGLVLAAVLAVQWASARVSRARLRAAALTGAAVVLIVIPAVFMWPLRSSTSYVGMYGALEEVCAVAYDGSAVLLTTRVAGRFGPAVRSFCGVPVAGIPDSNADPSCVILEANRAWADRGVNLLVGYRDEIELVPLASVDVSYQLPEFTLRGRPDQMITHRFAMNVADADGLDTSACPPR
jgi:hypothetical protein